jgi:hypothetical protein
LKATIRDTGAEGEWTRVKNEYNQTKKSLDKAQRFLNFITFLEKLENARFN